MAHSLVMDYFESLWHYGLPLTNPSQYTEILRPSNLTHCSLPSQAFTVNCDQGSLRSLFALMDQDSDGQISVREIHSLFARLGLSSNSQGENDLRSLIQLVLSPNQHQHISSTHDLLSLDFPQFAELYTSLFPAAQNDAAHDAGDDDLDDELLDAFRIYDMNHDGFISAAELAAVLSDLKLLDQHSDIEAHVATCQAYIDRVDLDGNGMVDLEEFKVMMMTSQQSYSPISVFAH